MKFNVIKVFAISAIGILASACSHLPQGTASDQAPAPVITKTAPPASRPIVQPTVSSTPKAPPPANTTALPATPPASSSTPNPAKAQVNSPTPLVSSENPAASNPSSIESTVVVAEPVAAPTTDADLYARIVRGFKMPALDTHLVAEKEKAYLSNPAYLQRMFTRGGRYMFHIVEELEKRGMPTELALLPMVESAMNPVAASHAKAVGLWQFIPSTGKAFNLSQNWWVDNRRDVLQSTRAALDYLQKIYEMQGNDWFLGLASYNWGEGAVKRAVKNAQAVGKSGDYLSLNMPAETRHYVPKLIALKNILARSKELNLNLPELANKPYFVMIEKTRPIDLKLAVKFSGMSTEEFIALNPAHNRPVIAASKNNQIILPSDRLQGFIKAVDEHESGNKVFASWQPYTIKSGESLDQIAARGKVTVAELRKANSLRDHQRILPGTRIIAPQSTVHDEKAVEAFVAPRVLESVAVPPAYHTVGRKETAQSIAGRYGISVASLKLWNGLKKGVARGMQLVVRQPHNNTVLTTESGTRQVVGSKQSATIMRIAKAPVEKRTKTKKTRRS